MKTLLVLAVVAAMAFAAAPAMAADVPAQTETQAPVAVAQETAPETTVTREPVKPLASLSVTVPDTSQTKNWDFGAGYFFPTRKDKEAFSAPVLTWIPLADEKAPRTPTSLKEFWPWAKGNFGIGAPLETDEHTALRPSGACVSEQAEIAQIEVPLIGSTTVRAGASAVSGKGFCWFITAGKKF